MARRSEFYRFHITVKLPKEENKEEYDLRIAKTMAKILLDTLSTTTIDELIESSV